MRILFINHEFPPVGGGAATVTRELFTRFEKSGHAVHLLTGKYPFKNQKITSVSTGRKKNSEGSIFEFIRFILFGIFRLRKIHKKFNPNIVFAFFTIPAGVIARINKYFYKVPYVVSVRGGDMPGFQLGKKHERFQTLANPIIRRICNHANCIHVNSERLYTLTVQNAIDPDKVTMLPNGIKITDESISKNRVIKKVKLLYTGRLSKQKNLDTFLKSLSGIKLKYVFTIIGSGPEKDNLLKIVEKEKLSVVFIDWMNREALHQIYKEYHIFVLPSLDEGMSNSALEAVSSQCALLASKNAHLHWKEPELMKEWVVGDYLDPQAWHLCLVNIFNKLNNINKISKVMKEFIIENNNWDRLFPKYEEMIEKCVE